MKPQAITSTVLLIATSLQFLHTPGWPSALMFATSTLLFGLILFLERSKVEALDGLTKRMDQIENKINGLSIAKGFGR